MMHTGEPVIVRRKPVQHYVRPGTHSHNITRHRDTTRGKLSVLRFLQILLLVAGLSGLGYYGYTIVDQYVYQVYENWAFDQQIAGHPAVTFADYLRQQTPFGFLVGPKATPPASVAVQPAPVPPAQREIPNLAEGSLLGRVAVERLNLSAIVREGVDAKTLSSAVGHIPSTTFPGQPGNFAIAAHRDTLFRALKDIRKDDLVTFQAPSGTYTYKVLATKIVRPSDVSVLRPDGGGLIGGAGNFTDRPPDKLLTMITCYPFYYVGSAPKRFIVEGKLISDSPTPDSPKTTLAVAPAPTKTTVDVPVPTVSNSPPMHANRTASKRHSSRRRPKRVIGQRVLD